VAKNLVGSFYQPGAVISDTSAIQTLPSRQIRNGLAEIIKYGIIKDAALFRYLESNYKKIMKLDKSALEHIISRSAKIKADVVAKDELDRKRVRAVLNYGHTIGHAIETAAGYSGRYSHGEAIAIGMLAASRMASDLGLMKESEAGRVERLIKKAGLRVSTKGLAITKIYEAHLHDKKFANGRNRFILASRIGSAGTVDGVADSVIRNALKSCIKN
jgi:3-dehydroquinate synthase